jgi:hypothetical protein
VLQLLQGPDVVEIFNDENAVVGAPLVHALVFGGLLRAGSIDRDQANLP